MKFVVLKEDEKGMWFYLIPYPVLAHRYERMWLVSGVIPIHQLTCLWDSNGFETPLVLAFYGRFEAKSVWTLGRYKLYFKVNCLLMSIVRWVLDTAVNLHEG